MSAEKLGRAIREAMEADRENAFQFEKALTFANSTPPAMSADHIGDAQGWRDIATAPRDGREFQAWWKGQWQPRARFDPEFGSFQLWGRTDYDTEGWETFAIDGHWMPLPPPPSGHPAPIKPSADTGELRERVARIVDPAGFDDRWDVPGLRHEASLDERVDEALAKADAILDLIQSERAG